MKDDLQLIMETLEQAKRKVVEMKNGQPVDRECPEEVEDVELALDWALEKLRALSQDGR
jgi:hypothetical protein